MSSFMGQPPTPPQRAVSVAEVNRRARDLLEGSFPDLWVEGEISRPTFAASGHLYFSLKDADARIDAVMWARQAANLRFAVEDGQQVLARGRVTIYAPQGRYQIVCSSLVLAGEGALRAAMLRLKEKLEAEGLLAPERKRPLPFLPRGVGIVTSRTGAAVQDICKTIFKRFPDMRVVLCPVRVQGEGSAQEVAEGVRRIQEVEGLDVIIVGRGGGSLEDLWTFNEEVVARAIASSRLPVVSGVGHEIDMTIADLVADARAATPTAAAEMVVPRKDELLADLRALDARLRAGVERALRDARLRVEGVGRRRGLRLFPDLIEEERQGLDLLDARARRAVRLALSRERENLRRLAAVLAAESPLGWVRERRTRLKGLAERLAPAARAAVARARGRLLPLGSSLLALNPTAVLERGFSITRVVRDGKEIILRDGEEAAPGDRLRTTLARGGDLLSEVRERLPRGLS